MQNTDHTTEKKDFSVLTATELRNVLVEKDHQIQHLSAKLHWFEEQFRLIKHKHFAKSSEKHTALQQALFDEDEETVQAEINPEETSPQETVTYTRNKPDRNVKHVDTHQLTREIRYHDLSDTERHCECGQCLEKFGEERREELVFIPATLKVIEHVRFKYTCRRCEKVKTPKAIELPLPKCKAGTGLLTEMILNKYRYHLPFYRQRKMLGQYGIQVPDNTLASWVMKAAEQLEPLGEALWRQLSMVHVLQVDETPVKLLEPEKQAYMWLFHCYLPGKRFIIFDFNLSRRAAVVNERLKDYTGLLQTDGYSGYSSQRQRPDIVSLGCWDHARRKYIDVINASGHNKSGKAGQMVEKIAKLYAIEESIKMLSYEERNSVRQAKAKPLLDTIFSFLNKIHAPPKSLLGAAVTYSKNQWQELVRYLDYGEAQISNCWVENQVRPFAVGKLSWFR